jgi:hypothetical protein
MRAAGLMNAATKPAATDKIKLILSADINPRMHCVARKNNSSANIRGINLSLAGKLAATFPQNSLRILVVDLA